MVKPNVFYHALGKSQFMIQFTVHNVTNIGLQLSIILQVHKKQNITNATTSKR